MTEKEDWPTRLVTRMVWRLRCEFQRVFCGTCDRYGRYVFHWHRGHRIGAP